MNVQRAAVLAAIPAILVLSAASPALARGGGGGGGGDVRASGPCATGDWKLKAKIDDGRVAAEAEIDTNRVGQVWTWQLSDNGTTFARGSSKTVAPSGSFSVHGTTSNRPGVADTIRLTAMRGTQTCRGVVTLP
jgi:hypothetical protein